MVNKHTVDYHPSASQLVLRTHTLISLWTPKEFCLSRIFLKFFPKPVYSTMVSEKFQIYSVKITANTFVSQKIKSVHFYSCSQAKLSPGFLSLSSRQTGIVHSSGAAFFEDTFPEEKRGERIMELKKMYRWQVLINSTIFATFTFLVYVLLCDNLASSMLKCEGSLT